MTVAQNRRHDPFDFVLRRVGLTRKPRKSPIVALRRASRPASSAPPFSPSARLSRRKSDDAPPKDWSDTPEPAQVGQRVAEGVFEQDVPLDGECPIRCVGMTKSKERHV
jgi:hypothetical protein